jgi:hypothetical protein
MNQFTNLFRIFQHEEEYFESITDVKSAKNTIGKQLLLVLIFMFVYGIIMGSYNSFAQSVSTSLKLPLLIYLSIFICFPAFFVIQFMLGSRMTLTQMLGVVLSGFIVFSTIAVSFVPIVLFFMITGDNYAFIKLLHVGILMFSGLFAMRTIIRGLKYSCERQNIYPKQGLRVFKVWIFIFAFVGMQLAWNLRPFVGSRNMQFELVREKEGNFYLAIIESAYSLVSGKEAE